MFIVVRLTTFAHQRGYIRRWCVSDTAQAIPKPESLAASYDAATCCYVDQLVRGIYVQLLQVQCSRELEICQKYSGCYTSQIMQYNYILTQQFSNWWYAYH